MYAKLIKLKNQALAALSSIEVQLRKRYDLIPQTLKLAKKYMVHERSLLEDIVQLRNYAMRRLQHLKHIAQNRQMIYFIKTLS